MISSVTTVVSTVVSGNTGLASVFGLCAVLFLVTLLVVQQLATNQGSTLKYFTQNLRVAVMPLLVVFFFGVLAIVWGIIS